MVARLMAIWTGRLLESFVRTVLRPFRAARRTPRRSSMSLPAASESLEIRRLLSSSAVIGVNATSNVNAISPDIYGAAFATTAELSDLNLTVNREGGNNASTYNWQQDADNLDNDYYFESYPQGSGNGQSMDTFVSQTKAGGAQPDLTIPIEPYVASLGPNGSVLGSYPVSVYGQQQSTDPYYPNFGNGVTPQGQNILDTNILSNYVANSPAFEQAWIQHLISTSGAAGSGGVQYFTLGNEPGLWNSTNMDIHPNGETNQELLNDLINYGSMLKSIDPSAVILGPEEWGWTNYFIDGADSAAQNWGATYTGLNGQQLNAEQWLLQQLQQYQTQHGERLLDYFTLHYYPQEGSVDSDAVDTATELLRNQVTRSLWDPNYVDPSWIGQTGINNGIVDLIPTMKSWVNGYYPGTKTGITEYQFGADGNMNGATAQADVYGIFGQQGLDLATRWGMPATGSPTYLAMKLWRNYDGNDSGFGDTSVGATVADPDDTDAFSAIRSSDGALTVAVINKNLYDPNNPTATTQITVNLSGFANNGVAQEWQLAAINPSDQTNAAITHLTDIHFTGNSFTINVPMESVTMFVIEPATTTVNHAPVGISSTVTMLENTSYALKISDFGFSDPNDNPPNSLMGVYISKLPLVGTLTDNGKAVTAGMDVPATDIATSKLVYTPAIDASRTPYAAFTFHVQDNGGTGNGGHDTDPTARTVTFNVTHVNQAPQGTSKTITILENKSHVFTTSDFGFSDPNDSPPNAFMGLIVSAVPLVGVLSDNETPVTAGMTIPAADIAGGKLVYTPAADHSRTPYAGLTFHVLDNGGTANGGHNMDPTPRSITINVTHVNQAPVGTSTTVTIAENSSYVLKTSDFGFSDPNDSPSNTLMGVYISKLPLVGSLTDNGNPVTAGMDVPASDIAAGKLVYTPVAGMFRTPYAAFTFHVQDNGGTANGGVDTDPNPKTVTFNVTQVTPTATSGAATSAPLTFASPPSAFIASDLGNPLNNLLKGIETKPTKRS